MDGGKYMSDFVEMANNAGKRTLLNLRFVVGIKEEDDGLLR